MGSDEIKVLVRKQPFEPIEIALSDGRSVLVRHPDQVIVSKRHVIFGIAEVRRSRSRVSTPANGDAVAKDWLLVDLVHVVGVEPLDDTRRRRAKRRTKKP